MASRTFWRIVQTDPPTVRDFLSNEARRRRPRDDAPETLRLWSGLSMYSSEGAAHRTARTFPRIGGFLGRVDLEEGDDVQIEKTLGPDHFTIWGDPSLLLSRVAAVVPVERSR